MVDVQTYCRAGVVAVRAFSASNNRRRVDPRNETVGPNSSPFAVWLKTTSRMTSDAGFWTRGPLRRKSSMSPPPGSAAQARRVTELLAQNSCSPFFFFASARVHMRIRPSARHCAEQMADFASSKSCDRQRSRNHGGRICRSSHLYDAGAGEQRLHEFWATIRSTSFGLSRATWRRRHRGFSAARSARS